MRKLALVFLLLVVVPSSLLAQSSIERERWREGRRDYSRFNAFEITPFGGYRWGGTLYADRSNLFRDDLSVAANGDYGVNLGIPLGFTPMKLELMINRQETGLQLADRLFEPSDRVADFDITYYHAGLQIPFSDSYGAVPFFVLSAGVANLKPHLRGVSADNRFSGSAGIGVKVPISRNIGVRVEGRGYYTSLGNYDDNCRSCYYDDYGRDLYQGEANVGLVISF
jgi:hypothetical protein